MRLTKKQRDILRNKYGGRCAYCGCELGKTFHADHLEPVERVYHVKTVKKDGKYELLRLKRMRLEIERIERRMKEKSKK